MKLLDEEFRNGQASYQRGIGLRTIFEEVNALLDANDGESELKGLSRAVGYLDGVIASIRRTDNLLLMPAGPDK